MDFTTWTRQDFIDFDNRRAEVFTPTTEELAQIEAENKQKKEAIVKQKLERIGYWSLEKTKEAVIPFLYAINAQQFIWADVEKWVDNQILLYWDTETAFNEIIYNYL